MSETETVDLLAMEPSQWKGHHPSEADLQGEHGRLARDEALRKADHIREQFEGVNGVTSRVPRQRGETDQQYIDRLYGTSDGGKLLWYWHALKHHAAKLDQEAEAKREAAEAASKAKHESALADYRARKAEMEAVVEAGADAEAWLVELYHRLEAAAKARKARSRVGTMHNRAAKAAEALGKQAPAQPKVGETPDEVDAMLRRLAGSDLVGRMTKDL
ncbi:MULTISPECIES: hypothetical protein [Halorhodospira]|uniref:hypothetical protein n=1 Tax=Halorhodospira TaxID=85108 RepID=UPI001EE8D3BC|nr:MULTISPECIES: hypothetical protein [Halorhodospira]MCG5527348.1 hypothetical protein [Halorhodospira halophila]MCG5543658.1 hypothetical protein [Halorhodospira sp. 9628]